MSEILEQPDRRGLVVYPIPFADGTFGELRLPVGLTVKEAEHVVNYVRTLPIQDETELR